MMYFKFKNSLQVNFLHEIVTLSLGLEISQPIHY